MLDLNKIKELRLYKNKQLRSFDSDLKDYKKNQLIIHIGNSEEDLISFLNDNIFSNTYFFNYYVDRLIVSDNKVKKRIINRIEYYKNIKEKTNKVNLIFKNSIASYGNKNLIYDLTIKSILNSETSRKSIAKKIDDFFYTIKNTLNNPEFNSYDKKIILFNIDNMNMEDKNSFLYYIDLAIKRKLQSFIDLKGVVFVFYSISNKAFFKVTISEDLLVKKKSVFKLRLDALKNIVPINDIIKKDEEAETEEINDNSSSDDRKFSPKTKEEKKDDIKNAIKNTLDLNNNDITNSDTDNELINNIENNIDEIIEEGNSENLTEEELFKLMNSSDALKNSLKKLTDNKINGHKKINPELLKAQQDKLKFKDISLKDTIEDYKNKSIDHEDSTNGNVELLHEEIKFSNLVDFDKSYMKKKFNKDIVSVVKAFNNASDVGMFVKKIDIKDDSTDLDKKQLLSITFADDSGIQHNFNVDLPEIAEGRYLFVNGSKKVLSKQLTFLPIVKDRPERVMITTNYNKLFMTRIGQKRSEKLEYIKKIFTKTDVNAHKRNHANFSYKFGNSLVTNSNYLTSVEYNDLSSYIYTIDVDDYHLIFDQKKLAEMIDITSTEYNEKLSNNSKYDKEKYFPIGYNNNFEPLLSDFETKKIWLFKNSNYEEINKSISTMLMEYITSHLDDEVNNFASSNVKAGSSLTYSRIEINNKKVPLILLLSYELGLMNVLDRYHIKYEFTPKNKTVNLLDDISKIKFADGYLFYDNSLMRNTILLSGLSVMDTENINFIDMNEKEPYLDTYEDLFNSKNAAKGFSNTMNLLVDPITKEVLHELKLPENVFDLLLYANTLLEDLSFHELNDVSQMRIRCAEQVPAMLYKILADSFKLYKDTKNARNPVKVSVSKDILIKKLLELKSVENYSSLNPTLELEMLGHASFKGMAGLNMDAAYTKKVRKFSDGMAGVIACATPLGGKVGAVKQLTLNPKITSVYGFIDNEKKLNGNIDIYNSTELLNWATGKYADPPRIIMQTAQQRHLVSIKEQDPPLIGTGIEKTVPYMISDEFAFKAKKDGKVKEIDYKNNLAILQYKDGTQDIVDLEGSLANNANGGFSVFQEVKLNYSLNDTFKKGSIIAYNPLFFSGNGKNEDIVYNLGKLTKIAVTSADFTFEDSSIITEKLSEAMSTKITMRKEKVIDGKSTVSYIAKEKSHIKTGEPLLIFESAFNDESVNDILNKIGSEFADEIQDMSKNTMACKYTGKIVKINIYYNDDIENYSESIQKILKAYVAKGNQKKKIIQSIKGKGIEGMGYPIVDKQDSEKIKGTDVPFGSVMFEFFIEHENLLGIGDKITYWTALKSIISDIIPKGQEPFSSYRTDESVDAILSPLSIVSRMTVDIYADGMGNKALIELKRKALEIYNS